MADACCGGGPGTGAGTGEDHDVAPERLRDVAALRAAALSGVLLAVGWIVRAVIDGVGGDRAALALEVAALIVGGSTFIPESVVALVRGRLGVGTLMTIAAFGAVLLGELGEAAGLAFLFSISEGLEGYSLARTRRGLRSLLSLVPDRVTVRRDASEHAVSPVELRLGDVLVVKPGERIATDGTILSGRTALDLSAITGESVPVEAGPDDAVYAGTINGGGALTVSVTATAEDNSLARIVHIVEEAQERKGASQRLADRVARPLVPGVMVLAVLIALVGSLLGDPHTWIERALVVLVAAAPCAFAISVPVTVVTAIGAASRFGVLIKGGAALEALGTIGIVALDKTGTLTRNEPVVIEVAAADGSTADEVLSLAAALESRSEHPLSAAILAAARRAGLSIEGATDVTAVPGSGLVGLVGSRVVRLGRPGFIEPGPLAPTVAGMQEAGATAVLVESADRLGGAVAVRDELRIEAADTVAALAATGIDAVMLTGDNERTGRAIADAAGIAAVHADLRPEDKARIVEHRRREGRVAMVGDGINDAPALATADVGIAMGAMGSDVAIETADVALLGSDLRCLPRALLHARRARRIMIQNLALSATILLTLVPLAGTGVLGLATVVLTHELAEVLVIANGLRAGRRASRSSVNAPPGVHGASPAEQRQSVRLGV